MKLESFSVLSKDEMNYIHQKSLHILSECGVKIYNTSMLSILQQNGCIVDKKNFKVRFPQYIVEKALSTIPDKFDMYDRNGKYAFTLGDGIPKVASGHNAVFWVDSETGETRPSKISDIEIFARLCENLTNIDMIGIPAMPQDVPSPALSLLYGVSACIKNCSKPIYFSTDNPIINRACIEMISSIYPNDISKQPYGITQLSPTSPLYWEKSVVEALIDSINMRIPTAILPEPVAGSSAPYTLAGLITMDNAECLSGLVMSQMIKPGAKVMYANSWTTTDMHTGSALVGSAETTICRIAGAQMAKFYNIPSHTTAPNSDNHAHDEQNSWEKTLSQFCSIAAGNDLIVNCGMFATGMTCSNEQLIIDDEITAISRRIAEGLNINDETIASDLIEHIGPHGKSYMTTDHTMNWLHTKEHCETNISVKGPYATWISSGSKDTYRIARQKVKRLAAKSKNLLSTEKSQIIDDIINKFLHSS